MSIQEIILKIKGNIGQKGFDQLVLGVKVILLVLGIVFGSFSCFLLGRISSQRTSTQETPIEVIYPPQIVTTGNLYSPALKKGTTPRSNTPQSPLKEGAPLQTSKITSSTSSDWKFAASKTGKVYYPNGCAGVNRIKSENRIYFMSREQAEINGLTLSKACK